ncbi:MAG TPA: gamma-glutamyl-gamma-aminobutyrate hydrolase family protein [Acidimicrobiales bacterium]|nr:gamma-glutamyl-gamma-aminobutyrate hydrolase family protein [Acidimicrobiales bacterium]
MSPTSGGVVIGISAYDDVAAWGAWKVEAAIVPASYARAVVRAGGVPVILPVGGDAAGQVASIDGLVLTGGPDVDPGRYGAESHEATVPASAERDAHEMALAEAATTGAVPLLAVCRGLQLLNVARGGTLVQHLPDVLGHRDHGPAPGVYGRHPVRVAEGSHLATALGQSEVTVSSHHHQAVDAPGAGLEAVAWAPDGTPEAYEDPMASFVVGVQWHPEVEDEPSLFEALVAAARRR